jgi:glutathione peroxidase-family protein
MGMGLLVGALPKPTLAAPVEAEDIRQILITYDGKAKRVGDVLGPKGTIVVNVASQCALTGGSYSGLVDVYDRYRDQGLEILVSSRMH